MPDLDTGPACYADAYAKCQPLARKQSVTRDEVPRCTNLYGTGKHRLSRLPGLLRNVFDRRAVTKLQKGRASAMSCRFRSVRNCHFTICHEELRGHRRYPVRFVHVLPYNVIDEACCLLAQDHKHLCLGHGVAVCYTR